MSRADPDTGRGRARTGPVWIATIGVGALATYLGVVLLLEETVVGVEIADWVLLPLLVGVIAALYGGGRWLLARGRVTRVALFASGVLGFAVAGSMVAIDVAYTLVVNRQAETDTAQAVRRLLDPHLWEGELVPRVYHPTEHNFVVHKPDVIIEADTYGEFYDSRMLASPTLRDSVLELRRVRFRIDANGFRETTPLAEAREFALGDSFVFGFGVSQELVWTEHFEALTGRPVYNLGVSATGPAHQVRLLRHLLDTHPGEARVERLIWMIFEGNDLENDYGTLRDIDVGPGSLLRGTVLETLRAVPLSLKRESVIDRMRRGSVRAKPMGVDAHDPTLVDGVRIPYPLYVSAVHGPRMFNPDDVERATAPRSYVRGHPNWPRLRETFAAMAALAREHGFPVTVVLAPSAARLYGAQFAGFPAISERPWFLEEVAALARAEGFGVIDLLPALVRHAGTELLYFRDDHHWNARGNRLVAEILARDLGSGPR